MLHLGTHMQSVKGSASAASFSACAMGTEWLQRGVEITFLPVNYRGLNKPDMTGASFQEGWTD